MSHKHRWGFLGIVIGDHRHGMAHRICKDCGAELYQPATKEERRRHDPDNELMKDGDPYKLEKVINRGRERRAKK